VVAQCGDIEAEAHVRIYEADRADTRTSETTGPARAVPSALRWKGEIPILKWSQFYTKMLTPFANVEGVKIRVEVELPAKGTEEQTASQRDKIKAALRELGLSDDVTVV